MGQNTVRKRINKLIAEEVVARPPSNTPDALLIAFIRHHSPEKGEEAESAVSRIESMTRLQMLAVDPGLPSYIRIAALGKLDATGDDMRIQIARTDHDHGVVIAALQTLIEQRRACEARDTKLEAVRLYLRHIGVAL